MRYPHNNPTSHKHHPTAIPTVAITRRQVDSKQGQRAARSWARIILPPSPQAHAEHSGRRADMGRPIGGLICFRGPVFLTQPWSGCEQSLQSWQSWAELFAGASVREYSAEGGGRPADTFWTSWRPHGFYGAPCARRGVGSPQSAHHVDRPPDQLLLVSSSSSTVLSRAWALGYFK
jgi:hypothetical protein